jgi:hypothetical protein
MNMTAGDPVRLSNPDVGPCECAGMASIMQRSIDLVSDRSEVFAQDSTIAFWNDGRGRFGLPRS